MNITVFLNILLILLVELQVSSTTVVATKCSDGIVIATDSQSNKGVLISSRTSRKLFLLTSTTSICSVNADTGRGGTHFQQLYNELKETIDDHKSRFDCETSASAICKMTRNLIATKYNEAHVVIAGYEDNRPRSNDIVSSTEQQQQPQLQYILTEVLPGGARVDQNTVAAGSGSTLIASLLDSDELSVRAPLCSQGGVEQKRLSSKTATVYTAAAVDVSALTAGVDNHSSSSRLYTVHEAVSRLKRCLSLASKLDPNTGGSKFTVWALSPSNSTGGSGRSSGSM